MLQSRPLVVNLEAIIRYVIPEKQGSQEKKFLEKVQVLAAKGLKKSELGKVLFLQPEELYFLLEEEAAALAGKEERVKGYRVKTSFSPVREGEKKAKRDAVAKVIQGAIKRRKKEKKDEKDEKDE